MGKYAQEKSEQQSQGAGDQGNGRLWESFPKPTGWSARWDGLDLDREMPEDGQESASQADESMKS